MDNKYIVLELKGGDSFIAKNANNFFNTAILNIYDGGNLELFNEWANNTYDSIENFMSGAGVRDLIIILESGKIFGFKNAIPERITRMVDSSVNVKIAYNGKLSDDHPYIKTHVRKRKIQQINVDMSE
jgi:hypothetical protein